MNAFLKSAIAMAGLLVSVQAVADVTFYEHRDFQGRAYATEHAVSQLGRVDFSNNASSVIVRGEAWEVCAGAAFSDYCVVLRPGGYASLADMGMNDNISSARTEKASIEAKRRAAAPPQPPQVTFYEGERFEGRTFTTAKEIRNFRRFGFNDRASSAVVQGERYEVCDGSRFRGRCKVLRPGRYDSLAAMGMNDRVSSVRAVGHDVRVTDDRYAPAPVVAQDYRRRGNERLYQANVTSVRAVVATPEQRCWVERQEVPQAAPAKTGANVTGALVGAVLGGILGHQVGNGSGQDLATVGGVVAGAAVGSQVGRGGSAPAVQTQDVKRCENLPGNARTEFWDVTYTFRGEDHRVQMTAPPGQTVTVNGRGEPRA